MSLDVRLETKKKRPVRCDHCWHEYMETETLYSANITHNLGKMASEAGIYQHLWRPEELRIKTAKRLIKPLEEGLWRLKSDPEHFKKFNADNGWGLYEHFVPFVEEYLEAIKMYPDSQVTTSR